MLPQLLSLNNINLTFGGSPLFEGAELSVSVGERLCLVGRNGSGKSTLLKLAAGIIEPDSGERIVQPGTTIRYLPQEPNLSGFNTVWDYVLDGLGPRDKEHQARRLISRLGLNGEEKTKYLSGGELRRAAIARTLGPIPDILLLDEPTNHLDISAIEWLEQELSESRAAIVVISHDRWFLKKLSTATVWIDRSVCRRLADGFDNFEAWRDNILENEEISRHKLDRKIIHETRWLNRGVTARRKRNMGRLRALIKMRKERKNLRRSIGVVDMTAIESQRSGKRVIEAKEICKSFEQKMIIKEFSVRIMRGDRVGVVGQNGAGKTTLVNVMIGALSPDRGTVELGTNIDLVTLDQRRESLAPTTRLADALTGKNGDSVYVGGKQKHVISYMQDFLFQPDQSRTPIGALSGGERGRLMLARAFSTPSNLLVLDEPTNDLDIETLDLLQELLTEYLGTAIIVSHDRDFLDKVVTSLIVSEGNGDWIEYAGGYTDMCSQGGRGTDENSPKVRRRNLAKFKNTNKKIEKTPSKLTYNDQRALDILPEQIEKLQLAIDEYRLILAEDGLFLKNPKMFQSALEGLNSAQVKLATAEDDWLNLAIRRDEMENH